MLRGAISVTERTGYIVRIRDLARLIAIEYVSSREKLGYPLQLKEKTAPLKKAPVIKTPPKFNPKKRQDFLLEIGSEQLPATFVSIGCPISKRPCAASSMNIISLLNTSRSSARHSALQFL